MKKYPLTIPGNAPLQAVDANGTVLPSVITSYETTIKLLLNHQVRLEFDELIQIKVLKGFYKMGKYFGTDGVRGEANVELTPELAFKLGRFGVVMY